MINWQRIWDDDGNICYLPIKIIASILSFFYLVIISIRNCLYDHKILKEVKLSCPVISVGNITVGGTGKTPCVIMLARMLQEKGFKPAVISRGYGSRQTSPVSIVSDGQRILLGSKMTGDEPYLIAHLLKDIPVVIGAKRILAGKAAIDQFGANVLICDDAMQHRQIFRDINLVLFDSNDLRRTNHILPWGRLREPIEELKRADAIVLTRTDEVSEVNMLTEKLHLAKNIPIFKSIHHPADIISGDEKSQKSVDDLKGKKICAFCGVANPASFKKTLLSMGATVVSWNVFPDHHAYTKKELEKLKSEFVNGDADYMVTTQKDAVRLQNESEFLKTIFILRVKMQIESTKNSFDEFIVGKLNAARQSKRIMN